MKPGLKYGIRWNNELVVLQQLNSVFIAESAPEAQQFADKLRQQMPFARVVPVYVLAFPSVMFRETSADEKARFVDAEYVIGATDGY